MNQPKRMSLGPAARLGAFAGSAVIAGPVFMYLFAALTGHTLVSVLPFVAITLVAVSYLFGLLTGTAPFLVRAGAVAWSLAVTFCSPAIFLIVMCFGRQMLHISGGCFA